MEFQPNLGRLKEKVPQLLMLAIATIAIVAILFDFLEDALIEGGLSAGGPLDFLLNAIVRFVQGVPAIVSSWGYAGIFMLMLLESSSLPFPSEIILPFSGYLVSTGQLNLWAALFTSTLAGITGSLVDYYIGMKAWSFITGRKAPGKLLTSARLQTAGKWFDKHGPATVFLSRMVPGFRTLVSFPAGAAKMPLPRFIAYTLAGCLVWNGVLIYVGMYVGTNWQQVAGLSQYIILSAVAAIVLLLAVLLTKGRRTTQSNVDD